MKYNDSVRKFTDIVYFYVLKVFLKYIKKILIYF